MPPAEKAQRAKARRDSLAVAGAGAPRCVVRVNNDPALLLGRHRRRRPPGPRRPGAAQGGIARRRSRSSSRRVEALERPRGLAPGHVRLSLAIETPRGLLRAEAIAAASDRIATMSVGVEDYCLELGVEPSADGIELLYAVAHVVTDLQGRRHPADRARRQHRRVPRPRARSRARPSAPASSAARAPGASTPTRWVLNRVFSPDPAKVEYARRVVEAFEEGVRRGTASVNLDGKMVDVPVVQARPGHPGPRAGGRGDRAPQG